MSLTSSRPTLKAALLALTSNENPDKTPDATIEEFLDALEAWIKTATVTVPGTGLVAPNGAVTGTSTTGFLT